MEVNLEIRTRIEEDRALLRTVISHLIINTELDKPKDIITTRTRLRALKNVQRYCSGFADITLLEKKDRHTNEYGTSWFVKLKVTSSTAIKVRLLEALKMFLIQDIPYWKSKNRQWFTCPKFIDDEHLDMFIQACSGFAWVQSLNCTSGRDELLVILH